MAFITEFFGGEARFLDLEFTTRPTVGFESTLASRIKTCFPRSHCDDRRDGLKQQQIQIGDIDVVGQVRHHDGGGCGCGAIGVVPELVQRLVEDEELVCRDSRVAGSD